MHAQKTEKKPRVLLLGASVLIESVAKSLSSKPNLDVRHVEFPPDQTTEIITSNQPDMIIFELGHAQPYPLMPLVSDQSDMLLLGLDPDSSRAIVLNTRPRLTRTMDELYKAVKDELSV